MGDQDSPPLWTQEQGRVLQGLDIIPFDPQKCEKDFWDLRRGTDAFDQALGARVEAGKLYEISGERYYTSLRRQGRLRLPIQTFNDANIIYLKRICYAFGGEDIPRDEDLREYLVFNNGFWPLRTRPYIVACPSALSLPSSVISFPCILNIYEVDEPATMPKSVPKYAKDLMQFHLLVMKQDMPSLLFDDDVADLVGMCIFVLKDPDMNTLDRGVPVCEFFLVSLSKEEEQVLNHTGIQVLSDHYMQHTIPSDRCSIEIEYLNPDNLNEYPWQRRPMREGRPSYECGQSVIRRKDGVWGMILQEREHIDAETGDLHREFGISCDKDILKEGKLKPVHRLKYYPTSEIMGVFACPPVRFPIHPTKMGQRVVVYGAGNSNKLCILDGSCGVVNAVIEDGPRTSLMCTVAVQEEYPSMETTQIDVKLKYTRFLLLDNEQYVSHQSSDYDNANIPRRIIYKFENLTFCEIKKLFETAEKSRLVHKCSKGTESLVPGDDTLDILEQKRKEAGHQDYVAWLASCVHSDPFFGKTCERRANERSETYVALQKPTETIAVLTCSRGQQKAVPATSKQGKKVNCEYRTRLTKFRYEDAIYAEALQTHTNHEPGSGDYHEPETPRLKRALDDLYDLGFKPAKAVNVIKYQTGATRHDLTVEERHLLNKTMADCPRRVPRQGETGRRDSLILKFLDEVTPRYLDRLQKRLQGAEKANARVNQNKHLTGVDTCGRTMQPYCATGQGSLSDSCLVKFNVDNQMFYCCTGDLSCTCDDNGDDICMHVEAAMKKYPITYEMVRKVASVVKSRQHEYVQKMATPAPFHGAEEHHVELSDVEIDEDNTVYQCLPVCFYHLGPKPRRKYFVNMYYKTCTCHCFSFFGTCPHVIALGATDEDDMDPAEKLQKSVQIRNDTHVNAEWERALARMNQQKLSVLMVSHEMTPTGAVLSLLNLYHGLSARGHAVDMLSLDGGYLASTFGQVDTSFTWNQSSPSSSMENGPEIYDAIVANTIASDAWLDTQYKVFGSIFSNRLLWYVRELPLDLESQARYLYESLPSRKNLMQLAHSVLFVSRSSKALYEGHYDLSPRFKQSLRVVNNALNADLNSILPYAELMWNVDHLINNPEIASSISKRSCDLVSSKFSSTSYMTTMENILRDIALKASSPR
eukprot:jgi/Picre1/32240/NNA_007586.t1